MISPPYFSRLLCYCKYIQYMLKSKDLLMIKDYAKASREVRFLEHNGHIKNATRSFIAVRAHKWVQNSPPEVQLFYRTADLLPSRLRSSSQMIVIAGLVSVHRCATGGRWVMSATRAIAV